MTYMKKSKMKNVKSQDLQNNVFSFKQLTSFKRHIIILTYQVVMKER